MLEGVNELSLPPLPSLLPARSIGRLTILFFLEFDIHESEMLQSSQLFYDLAIGLQWSGKHAHLRHTPGGVLTQMLSIIPISRRSGQPQAIAMTHLL